MWRAFADGQLPLVFNTWPYQAMSDLLTWDSMGEHGIDAEVAAAIVERIDPAQDRHFATHLAPFVKRALDEGAPITLTEASSEVLARP